MINGKKINDEVEPWGEEGEILNPRFELGRVVATPTIVKSLDQGDVFKFIERHAAGDWGDTCKEDRVSNESAIEHGDRIVSSYILKPGDDHGERVLIITEADRSATTVMYMSEY